MNCRCNSGFSQYPIYDGHGIFLTYVCELCVNETLKGYRPDILERYECDEPIEPD
jgi:hypothetical protein